MAHPDNSADAVLKLAMRLGHLNFTERLLALKKAVLEPAHVGTVTPGHGPFRFFDLPRELRDRIYEQWQHPLLIFEPSWNIAPPAKVTCPSFCDPGLRLTNRQFKGEYEEAIWRSAAFTIDVPLGCGPYYDLLQEYTQALLSKARKVILQIHPPCQPKNYLYSLPLGPETADIVRDHFKALLAVLPSLRSFELGLVTDTKEVDRCVRHGNFKAFDIFDIELDHKHAHVAFSKNFYFPKEDPDNVNECLGLQRKSNFGLARYLDGLRSHPTETVSYRGTKSEEASSWHGMRLEITPSGDLSTKEMYEACQWSDRFDY